MKRSEALGALFLLSVCGRVAAEVTSYTLPLVREGKTTTRLAYEFWSGEYPGPIIDLNSQTPGTTTVLAHASVRDLSETQSCAIQNGVYHPWSKGNKSLITFYTLTAQKSYRAEKDHDLDSEKIKKGDTISHVVYLAEGSCQAQWSGREKKGRSVVVFSCDELENPRDFKPLEGQGDPFLEQWLYVRCGDGSKAFVQDKQLLAAPGAKEGQLVGYGEVKGAE